jgi:hypothetical protein
MRAAIYARVSSEAQAARGTIGSQLALLEAKVAEVGDELVARFVDDGHSGTRLDRPGLDALRDGAQAGVFERVWVLTADRLARNFAYQMLVLDELDFEGRQRLMRIVVEKISVTGWQVEIALRIPLDRLPPTTSTMMNRPRSLGASRPAGRRVADSPSERRRLVFSEDGLRSPDRDRVDARHAPDSCARGTRRAGPARPFTSGRARRRARRRYAAGTVAGAAGRGRARPVRQAA